MSRFEVLLFDLDGTLTDSAPGILNCARYALTKMGREIPDDLNDFIGPPLTYSFSHLFGMNEEDTEKAIVFYRERYSTKGLFENDVYDGVPEMLERLHKAGFTLGVATNKPERFANPITEHFGIAKYFKVIAGSYSDSVRNSKPEIISYAMEQLGVTDRDKVLMIGDRCHDIVGAHDVGIKALGILWGYGDTEELAGHGADYLADTPQEAADRIINGQL